jgi:hypothetical protein
MDKQNADTSTRSLYLSRIVLTTFFAYISVILVVAIILVIDPDDTHNPFNLLLFPDQVWMLLAVPLYYFLVAMLAKWLFRGWLSSLLVYVVSGILYVFTLPLTHKMSVIYTSLNENYHYSNEMPSSAANSPGLHTLPVENVLLLVLCSMGVAFVFWLFYWKFSTHKNV